MCIYNEIWTHPPINSPQVHQHSSLLNSCPFFSPDNPVSPPGAGHMCMGMRPSTGAWEILQRPHIHRRMILPPAAISYQQLLNKGRALADLSIRSFGWIDLVHHHQGSGNITEEDAEGSQETEGESSIVKHSLLGLTWLPFSWIYSNCGYLPSSVSWPQVQC